MLSVTEPRRAGRDLRLPSESLAEKAATAVFLAAAAGYLLWQLARAGWLW